MPENLVDVIERRYDGSTIHFEMGSIITGWSKCDSGVRQGCPVSQILFNMLLREMGMKIAGCKQGFKNLVMYKDGVTEKKS